MDQSHSAAIDLVEAAYDLALPPAEWLPRVLETGASIFDRGLGHYGVICAGMSEEGVPVFSQVQSSSGAEELPLKVWRAAREAGPELVASFSGPLVGQVVILSALEERHPRAFELLTRGVGCRDMLSLVATDPNAHGVNITMPSPTPIRPSRKEMERWQMLGVHLAAGHRLRSGLIGEDEVQGQAITEMPLRAEAVLDPKQFLLAEARGPAQEADAATRIREAARMVDRARGVLRKRDPEQALRIWRGLVRGRWSLVDWFDTDGRRFVLAKPNAPHIRDPRGLSQREALLATYAALGESRKLISYRTGLHESTVSRTLDSAMRKLGASTQAQLVEKMRGFPNAASLPSPSP